LPAYNPDGRRNSHLTPTATLKLARDQQCFVNLLGGRAVAACG
jgi:hypothetical protein